MNNNSRLEELKKALAGMKSRINPDNRLTFVRLVKEVREWADYNFGDIPSEQPVLGVIEELGELSHAHLKTLQGIRNNEDHFAAKKDAVGDILIYLADYCGRALIPVDLSPSLGFPFSAQSMGHEHFGSRTILKMAGIVGLIAKTEEEGGSREEINGYVTLLLFMLADYCRYEDIDLQEAIETTWGKVSKRDWRKNPDTAHQVAESEEPINLALLESNPEYVDRLKQLQRETDEGQHVLPIEA
jgi:NTP pyrophosphatase (non-canonical NTP hydrolase)